LLKTVTSVTCGTIDMIRCLQVAVVTIRRITLKSHHTLKDCMLDTAMAFTLPHLVNFIAACYAAYIENDLQISAMVTTTQDCLQHDANVRLVSE